MKRIFRIKTVLSLALALVITASVFTSSAFVAKADSSVIFTDISETAWYYENVKYVSKSGIMKGVSADRFAPNDTLSRAMSVTILYRMAGEPDVGEVQHPFTDVKSGKWYTDAVAWAYDSGITTGKTETSFAPNDEISRGEFAALLLRYTEYAELVLPAKRGGNVADEQRIPFYAQTAARVMYQAKVINGRSGYKFEAHAKIMRAEAAAIIERLITNAVPKDLIVEPEVPEYAPELYTDVVFIGNSFTYTGNMPGQFHSIAENRLVKVSSYAQAFYSLESHYNWFRLESSRDELEEVVENADIIVFQEYGGFFPDEVYAEKLMDLFGRDKKYYAILPFFGPTTDDRYDGVSLPSGTAGNEGYMQSKKIYLEEHAIHVVYLSDVVNFDPELGLNIENFVVSKNDYHPNDLMGYCMALAMYCTIFDEQAAEQNDGDLSLYMIPGKTETEKEVYIKELKNTVQRILDIQK